MSPATDTMEKSIAKEQDKIIFKSRKDNGDAVLRSPSGMKILKGWQANWIDARVALHIARLALVNYQSIAKCFMVLSRLYLLKKSVLGGRKTKIVKINGKYHHYLYAPGYPSVAFDRYIEAEFHRILPISKPVNRLTFIFLAITSKCPLHCEHCLEWNNLNHRETLSLDELKMVVNKFQQDGISQFHLSGGEPMVRIKDLTTLIAGAGKQSEFYVLSSGFNFSRSNAQALKNAGLTGVVISLDHFDPDKHNSFRGSAQSYKEVMAAIKNAQEQNLVVAVTVCATRSFTTWENLVNYADLVKSLGVPFIQLLEPKAVGHYDGKDVCLEKVHFDLLEKFYMTYNFNSAYRDFPVIVYHGYHLRRVGCMSGGDRTLYIDSEGFINACPFCHTKNFNIKTFISDRVPVPSYKNIGCSVYRDPKSC